MSFDSELAAGLLEAEAALGTTLTHGSNTYACVASILTVQDSLDMGGQTVQRGQSFTLRRSVFGVNTLPVQGDRVTVNSVVLRVELVELDGAAGAVRLLCVEVTK
jgi:hypothetical protein